MDFRPAASNGAAIGIAALAAALAAAVLLAFGAARTWPGPAAALLSVAALSAVVPAVLLAYWLWGLLSMRYSLSRDGIVIRWAASRHTIPVGDITHILAGRPYASPLRGFRWPGHQVGRARLEADDVGERDLLVIATTAPEEQVILVTPGLAYAVSPADRGAFVDEFKLRLRLGAVQRLEHGSAHPIADRLAISRDALDLTLAGAALALNVFAFAWLIWHYPTLPESVALRHGFDAATGTPTADALQPLASAWLLPGIALATLVVNGGLATVVHGRARLGAHILMLGALLLQIVVLVVLLHMTP